MTKELEYLINCSKESSDCALVSLIYLNFSSKNDAQQQSYHHQRQTTNGYKYEGNFVVYVRVENQNPEQPYNESRLVTVLVSRVERQAVLFDRATLYYVDRSWVQPLTLSYPYKAIVKLRKCLKRYG